ncbi:MAG: DUF1616 domain-containing protein [Methanomassiliicoccales archaeon]
MAEGDDGQTVSEGLLSRFLSMTGRDRWTVVISLLCIFLMISLGWYALSLTHQDKFTEFYVLNEQGQAFDYPTNITAGGNGSLIIGLANHEGRTVNYTVEVWMIDFTFVNMTVNISQMYFMDSYNIVLESVPYVLDEDWVPQYEKEISLQPSVTGNFSLFIMLFRDDKPVYNYSNEMMLPVLEPLDSTVNYHTNENYAWRVVLCMRQDVPFLKVVLMVI